MPRQVRWDDERGRRALDAIVRRFVARGPSPRGAARRTRRSALHRGLWDGAAIRFRLDWVMMHPWLQVTAEVDAAALSLDVRRSGSPPLQEFALATGDPAFDREFIVEGAPRELAHGFLDGGFRDGAREARLSWLRAENATLTARFEIGPVASGELPSAEVLERLHRALSLVSRQARLLPELVAAEDQARGAAELGALKRARRQRVRRERTMAVVMVAALIGAAVMVLRGCL